MCQVQYLVGRAGQTVLTARCGEAGALRAGGGGGPAVLGGPGGRGNYSHSRLQQLLLQLQQLQQLMQVQQQYLACPPFGICMAGVVGVEGSRPGPGAVGAYLEGRWM